MSLGPDHPLYVGLDAAEREILDVALREGKLKMPRTQKVMAPKAKPAPMVLHEDVRDMREPKAFGEILVGMVTHRSDISTVLEAHDMLEALGTHVRPYDPGETTVTETARAYQAELQARAADGDKFAISMLTTGLPGDSDA